MMKALHKTTVALSFLGGEPLLYLSDIEETLEAIRTIAPIAATDFITNGVLINSDKIDFLKRIENSSLQVTLDGGRSVLNRFRHLANESGTYDHLLTTIQKLIDRNIHLPVRINATYESITPITQALLFE